MNKSKIINRQKKPSTEIKELKNLSKIFNNNFYKAVILLSKVKGRVIVTGVGKVLILEIKFQLHWLLLEHHHI